MTLMNDYTPNRTIWSLTNLGSGVSFTFTHFAGADNNNDDAYGMEIQEFDSCGLRPSPPRWRSRKLAREIWHELFNNGWVKS